MTKYARIKEKTMKKLFLLLIAVLTLSLFIGCGETPPEECAVHNDADGDGKCDVCQASVEPEEKPEEDPKEEQKEEKIALINDGEANFQIVVASSNASTSVLKKAVDNFVKALDGVDVKVKSVNETADNAKDCEIIIGVPTTRGDEYNYNIHDLGAEGYAIKVINGKILILGGSEEALIDAIELFIEEYLGIDKKTKELTDVVISSKQSVEEIQDNYRVTALKLNGDNMKNNDYTIAIDMSDVRYSLEAARTVQSLLYTKAGVWLDIVPIAEADKSIVIILNENTYEGDGYSVTVDGSTITFECEFPDKLVSSVSGFFAANVTVASGEVDFTKKHSATKNIRDLYYEEYGAKGNGVADDFEAMQACHEYANLWGHRVKGKSTANYYIGAGHGEESIIIKTDTDWGGCTITIDNTSVLPGSRESKTSLLVIAADKEPEELDISKFLHVTADNPWRDSGDVTTNIGYAPGEACMLLILSKERKQYIRYGVNEDAGDWQQELILVDAEGNIDPSTPLQWTYTQIDKVTKISTTERPITVGNLNTVVKAHRPSESVYESYYRNFKITRSNTLVKDVKHSITNEGEDAGCPFSSMVSASECSNVTIDNYTFRAPKRYRAQGSNGESTMGSYGLGAAKSNNVIFKNIHQTDLRDENGVVNSDTGAFGSNYCKNLTLLDSTLSLFDAHRGTYNATLINSEVRSLNVIGEGLLYLERVKLVGIDQKFSIGLREDYGSTWEGDVELIDCQVELNTTKKFDLFRITQYIAVWTYGYTCYFPQRILIDGLTCVDSKGNTVSGVTIGLSEYLSKNFGAHDISVPESQGGGGGVNPYIGCKEIVIKNCQSDITWIFPDIPMFRNTKVTVNDKVYENMNAWKALYGYNANKS